MKKMLAVLVFGLMSFGARAQVVVDGTNINDLDIKYVELVGQAKLLSLTKIKVFVDYGQDFSWKQQTIKNTEGKNAAFNSMIDALNFMDQNGWEYVSNYLINNNGELTYKFLLHKKEK
ncbi:MAG: hypothetical protein EBU82_06465 [Flavobacteriia bacterium]|jgi:hypothetical protein|nr:hypothetical protein [Flavobacteriia bacterium]NBP29931.1 hypothetical protein [Flavobacteriia bacterium]